MSGNINFTPIGKCSQCGGVVSLPKIWWSTKRPVPHCEKCGAVADEAHGLPVVPTQGGSREPATDQSPISWVI